MKMELVMKLAPWASALIALLALRLNIKWRREDQELRRLDQQYNDRQIFFESNQSWNHPLRLSKPCCIIRITNRDIRDITIRDACWAQIDNNNTWISDSLENRSLKLHSSDYLEFELDADEIMRTPFLNESMSNSIKMQFIVALRIQISLSTGECKKFMIGPYLQFYLLEKYVNNWFYVFIGKYLVKRSHNKAFQRTSR
jgi:hypothetical protein